MFNKNAGLAGKETRGSLPNCEEHHCLIFWLTFGVDHSAYGRSRGMRRLAERRHTPGWPGCGVDDSAYGRSRAMRRLAIFILFLLLAMSLCRPGYVAMSAGICRYVGRDNWKRAFGMSLHI
jgi:hypothetical protein